MVKIYDVPLYIRFQALSSCDCGNQDYNVSQFSKDQPVYRNNIIASAFIIN
jgi:hypothetical protein